MIRARIALAAALALTASRAAAQTVEVGDAWIAGRLGAGTTTPGARLDVVNSSMTTAAFQISGVDGTPFFVVESSGDVGLGVTPQARLDLTGYADATNTALLLRNGNYAPAANLYQLTFGANGAASQRHAIASTHISSTSGSGLDFWLWTPAQATAAVGSLHVLSLVTISTGAGSSVHIQPVGTPTVDLVVSNGVTTGGGSVERAAEVAPSSRELKTDIVSLDEAAEDQAAAEVEAYRPVSFRYRRWTQKGWIKDKHGATRRGLIYEETPDVLHGPGKSLVIDERIAELELATQSLIRRLEADDAAAKSAGGAK